MLVSAITFDLGGTLVESEMNVDGFNRALASFLRFRGYHIELDALKREIKIAYAHLSAVQEKGEEMTFEEVYSETLGRFSIDLDISALRELQELFREHSIMRVYPRVDQLLRSLSQEYKLGMICNTIHNIPRDIIAERGWQGYFNAVVISRDIGYRKPRPEIFRRALEILNVRAEETIHVGDRIDTDVEGALAVGMIPVWVSKNRNGAWKGYTIKNVCDLRMLLQDFL